MSELDDRLELLLQSAELDSNQKQALRETWLAIKAKGQADSLGTQQAVFSYGLAVAMGGSLREIQRLTELLEFSKPSSPRSNVFPKAGVKEEVRQVLDESKLVKMVEVTFEEAKKANRPLWLISLVLFVVGLALGILIEKMYTITI